MRRVKAILFSIISIAIVGMFGFEVFAAAIVGVSIEGRVEYYATEIGAQISGTYSYNSSGATGEATFLTLSGGGGTFADNIYEISGNETSYTNITASIGTTRFSSSSDTMTIYLFIKNTGDRYIIPRATVICSDTTHMTSSTATYYFDRSSGQLDVMNSIDDNADATGLVETVQCEIDNDNAEAFSVNSSIDNNDTWIGKITISLQNVSSQGSINVNSSFQVQIAFLADVQYTSNNILSVYQTENQSASTWTKYGYNATLSASPTKLETNSLSNLYTYLEDADSNGNANITFGRDDYINAVVYKDIDLVNVDVATGEIIGRLSDTGYDFEWYGRSITLEAGTELASGRSLTTSETFTVDVYTYYPAIFVRRWVVGGKQWISLSNENFSGAVRIPEYYTATFESTLFNPDKTVARNSYGVIPRSYIYDIGVCTSGSTSYFINNYGYTTYSGATNSTTQSQMMTWASNLTKGWIVGGMYDSDYICARLAQGENYTAYIYNLLYLVKYANNNSQETVGYGNTYTYSLYNASGVTVTKPDGSTITTGGNSTNSYYEAEKGGGTIGVYKSSETGTATYDSSNNYKMSSTGFNNAHMNYGYNSTYTHGSHKQGLYNVQFLTYSDGTTRHLLDGYVGSDRYTSVLCLGLANPWGNVWTWVFGSAVVSDGSSLYAFISFDDYNYSSSSSWYFSTNSSGYDTNKTTLTSRGYVELGYNLPTSNNYYRYCGTSMGRTSTGIDSLVGLPTKASSTASSSSGLADYYYCNNTTAYVFGVLRGGAVYFAGSAGAFYFHVNADLTDTGVGIGFRLSVK